MAPCKQHRLSFLLALSPSQVFRDWWGRDVAACPHCSCRCMNVPKPCTFIQRQSWAPSSLSSAVLKFLHFLFMSFCYFILPNFTVEQGSLSFSDTCKTHPLRAHTSFLSLLGKKHLPQKFPILVPWTENCVGVHAVGSREAEYEGQPNKDVYDSK